MAVSPARAAAFEILLRVERDQSYASELLHSARMAKLSPGDHGLATELVMGVLRWRSWLDQRLARASSQKLERLDPEVLAALRLGMYQLQFLSRVPGRAAIFESVELVKAAGKRSAASFTNAVLRKAAAEPAADVFAGIQRAASPQTLAETSAHPEWMVARWVERYGLAAAIQICLHDQAVPVTAIHFQAIHGQPINGQAIHIQNDQADEELAREGIAFSPGLLLSSARRVTSGNIAKIWAFREGRIAIQDEASQFVAILVGRGETILDCCAAPGRKTALLAGRNPDAKVFAVDLHPHRARLLRALTRQRNVHVIAADARHLPFQPGFDRILADVPCSGTGTLSRNPEIKWRLRPEDLPDLQTRQIAILRSVLAQLAPGGRLVYSTCSLENEENEAVVEGALGGTADFTIVDCREQLDELQRSGELSWKDIASLLAGPYLRTIPGLHPCDGFFAAMIGRTP